MIVTYTNIRLCHSRSYVSYLASGSGQPPREWTITSPYSYSVLPLKSSKRWGRRLVIQHRPGVVQFLSMLWWDNFSSLLRVPRFCENWTERSMTPVSFLFSPVHLSARRISDLGRILVLTTQLLIRIRTTVFHHLSNLIFHLIAKMWQFSHSCSWPT